MKRFFTKKSVALFLLSFVLFASLSLSVFNVAKAQYDPTNPVQFQAHQNIPKVQQALQTAQANLAKDPNNIQLQQDVANIQQTLTYDQNLANGSANVVDESFFGFLGGMANGLLSGAGGIAMTVIAYIFEFALIPWVSVYLAIAGKILDFAVQYSIYGSALTDFQNTVQSIWVITRDVCNVFFIFILLYIAIRQIIGQIGAELKGKLASIVIAALFINFSLFFTGIIIDAGNLIATALLNQIVLNQPASGNSVANSAVSNFAAGITGVQTGVPLSETIMDNLGLVNIYQAGAISETLLNTGTIGFIEAITRFILFGVTMLIFLFMALLLIGRLVMLIFLMATSPLGFMSGTAPFLDKVSSSWRDELFNQTLVAPVFMFFMLLIVKVSQVLMNIPPNSIVPAADASGNNLVVYFKYIFIIYLLIKAVTITKKLSGEIGNLANKAATGAVGLAIGSATGGTALLARQTIGRAAAGAAQSKYLQGMASDKNQSFLTRFGARMTLKGAASTSKATMDIRNTGAAKETFGFLKGEGVDIQGGQTKTAEGGYVGAVKRGAEAETKFAKEQLGRKDVTEEQAIKEAGEKTANYKADIAKAQTEKTKIKLAFDKATNEEDKKQFAKQAADLDKEIAEKSKTMNQYILANTRDAFGNLKKADQISDKKQKEAVISARNEILDAQKKIYQAGYANVTEHGIYNTIMGYNKDAADKIRKEVVKGKSNEQKLADIVKEMEKETGGDKKGKEQKEGKKEEKKPEAKPDAGKK